MIVYPLSPIIEPTRGCEPSKITICINLFTAATWMFLLVTYIFGMLRQYTSFSLVICYFTMWIYYTIQKAKFGDDWFYFAIFLTHLLCFLPLWTARLLRKCQ